MLQYSNCLVNIKFFCKEDVIVVKDISDPCLCWKSGVSLSSPINGFYLPTSLQEMCRHEYCKGKGLQTMYCCKLRSCDRSESWSGNIEVRAPTLLEFKNCFIKVPSCSYYCNVLHNRTRTTQNQQESYRSSYNFTLSYHLSKTHTERSAKSSATP